jgi:drug/metabolite transporter (DMT)-like permease
MMILTAGSAAGILTLSAVSFGGASVASSDRGGVAGWITSKYLPGVIYLAVIPGILGHTSFNALLKYLHPLAIALPLTLEPVIGSLIGYALGLTSPPSPLTYIGGGVLLAAVALVTISGYRRESVERERT